MFLFLFSDPSNCTDVQLRVQSIGEQCLLADVGNSSFYPGNFNSYSGHASFLQFLVRGTPEFTGPRRVRHRLHMRVHREERELQSLQQSQSVQPAVPEHPVHGPESFPGKSTTSNYSIKVESIY